jgi:hypothetical protein
MTDESVAIYKAIVRCTMNAIGDCLLNVIPEVTFYEYQVMELTFEVIHEFDFRKSYSKPLVCERCERETDLLVRNIKARDGMTYIYEENEDPDSEEPWIPKDQQIDFWTCWDCDNDLMNGGSREVDPCELEMDREEHEYEMDPINNDPPRWYNR